MIAYGGAGPLHAAMIARELRIGKLIIPFAPGHFSAYGMLFAEFAPRSGQHLVQAVSPMCPSTKWKHSIKRWRRRVPMTSRAAAI